MKLVGGLMAAAVLLNFMVPISLRAQTGEDFPSAGMQERDAYDRGLELRARGAWKEALELWEEASDYFTAPSDPRIAFVFLETTLENVDEARYSLASQMLLWGLSGTEYAPHCESRWSEELDRIIPLMEEDGAEPRIALRDSTTEAIARELKRFWIEKDPTPTSALNERLIEHWQRILHAREHFTYSLDSPYRTDDRGIIWVKFGPPDRTKTGMLGAGEQELKIRIPQDAQAREALRRYDTNPQFEVWVYDDLNHQGFTYFLFGNEDGRGRFSLVDGVRDLIPSEALSQSSARYTPGGVPASYYLELFYYEALSDVGGYFRATLLRAGPTLEPVHDPDQSPRRGRPALSSENTLRAYSYKYQMRDRSDPENPPEAPVYSGFEGRARDEMVVQTVRALRNNEPRLFILSVSASRLDVPDQSGLRRRRLVAPGSSMQHTLIVRDERLGEVGRLTERVTSEQGDVSTFLLRHVDLPMHLTVTAETILDGDSIAPPGEGQEHQEGRPFPGQAHLEPPPPLSTDTAHLEVSDLTVGVPTPENIDGSSLPFPLLPAPRIWWIDSLRVYLEVYHLGLDGQGTGHFLAEFNVEALREDGSVDESQAPVTLSVQLETDGAMFGAPFDIALRDKELGHYRVEVVVTDLMRGETVSRSARLELIG